MLRTAFRQLLKTPGFTALAIGALALGIGANVAIFSAINTLFLRPLSYAEPDRLYRVWGEFKDRGLDQANLSYPRFEALLEQTTLFEELAAQSNTGFTLTGRGDPEQVQASRVSDRFLPTLGVHPIVGRGFLPEENRPGGVAVVMLSHGYWQRRFGGDRTLVGQAITLDGSPHTVIGVLPATVGFPFDQVQVWAPRVFDQEGLSRDLIEKGTGYLTVTGRLRPGVTRAQLDEQLKAISTRYGAAHPEKVDANAGLHSTPLQEDLVGNQRPMFLVLLAAVGAVLLIACANVVNLLLARFTGRRKEIAIRTALGASRGRIVAQFLTESTVTAALAGVLGVLVAVWSIDVLARLGADFLPRAAELSVDGRVLAFAVGLSLLTGLALGIVPALHASLTPAGDALKDSSRGSTGGRSASRLRSTLLVVEVALSLVLLVGAGLLIGSFARLQQVDPGFHTRNIAVVNLGISPGQYATEERQATFHQRVIERLRAIPGVTHVAAASGLPLSGNFSQSPLTLEGEAVPPVNQRSLALRTTLTPGHFETLGIPLRQGRDFTWRDRPGSPNVVIINETIARRLFPDGANPIGRRLITGIQSIPREIVGVAANTRTEALAETPGEEMYYPTAQLGDLFLAYTLRTTRPAASLRAEVTAAIHSVDAGVPVGEVQPYANLLTQSISDRRLVMGLIGVFAALALLLAGMGIYSVIAYSVAQRTNEIGIRMALGAEPRTVLGMILREGLQLTALGLAVGLVVSLALTRLLKQLLFEISATDPVVFAGVALFLVVIATLACWAPARRATRVDPLEALRAD